MSDHPIDPRYIGRALDRLITDVVSLRDDRSVLTAIVMRLHGSHTALMTRMRAMHSQQSRLANRVRALATP